MILYDIFCNNCKHTQEIMLKLEEEIPPCPKCGEKMEKAVSCTTFLLKGKGWASTGYDKGKGKE